MRFTEVSASFPLLSVSLESPQRRVKSRALHEHSCIRARAKTNVNVKLVVSVPRVNSNPNVLIQP